MTTTSPIPTVTHLGTDKRHLLCKLTEDERTARADSAGECAELATQKEREHNQHKETAAALKKEFERKGKEAARFLQIYRAGEETRAVEVRQEYDETLGEVRFVRTDTGEVVERRGPTADDWSKINAAKQTAMDFAGGRGGRKSREGAKA